MQYAWRSNRRKSRLTEEDVGLMTPRVKDDAVGQSIFDIAVSAGRDPDSGRLVHCRLERDHLRFEGEHHETSGKGDGEYEHPCHTKRGKCLEPQVHGAKLGEFGTAVFHLFRQILIELRKECFTAP